jgi:L-ascorbate metabolism protein UlaG (beta-lactamase superfamily)
MLVTASSFFIILQVFSRQEPAPRGGIPMKVTYLAHSGFLVETDAAYYLFDYIRGTLPAFQEKPLYVFASHSHPDHFSAVVFEPQIERHVTRYLLSYDIQRKCRKSHPAFLQAHGDKLCWLKSNSTLSLPHCHVTTLRSTDLGVAFLVETGTTVLYHAGDLNWWHWEDEDKAWNRNMEMNYKREIEKLRGKQITLAFLPLDPRQGEAYWLGMDYFVRTADVRFVLPMHFWGEYGVIDRYLAEHGAGQPILTLEREEQEYQL